ncbi:DNA alkylation repair protein [bacterium]|nr:DNA alkylation repair protein [bacterium]
MSNSKLIGDITRELKRVAETDYQKAQQWFFKEEISLLGVRVGKVRAIGNRFYSQLKGADKKEIFDTAEDLMRVDLQELRVIGTQWARKQQKHFATKDFSRFERWLKKYVSNWAICDGVSVWLVGELLRQHPSLIPRTVSWRKSNNRWLRRAAAVALITPVRGRQNLAAVFKCADALLVDEDDMVQKGYGWLLKEASGEYPKEVFAYVQKRKGDMPRTALRYAIEKLPATKRAKAMAK